MKTAFILAVLLLGTAITTMHAGWIAVTDHARIHYLAQPNVGHATFDEALKELADANRVQAFDGIVAHALMHDETFQKELFSAFEHDSPRELKEALKSAGNLHNPKMNQLAKRFVKAVLATPTVRRINAALAAYGLRVSGAGIEKFGIRKNDAGPRFSGSLWLTVTKSPN